MKQKLIASTLIIPFMVLIQCKLNASKFTQKNKKEIADSDLAMHESEQIQPVDTTFSTILGDFKANTVLAKVNGKWGIYYTIQKKLLVQAMYDNIGSFASEGMIDFTINKKFGYINKEGVEIVAAKYDFASGFENGLASVELNEKWGFIDTHGKVAIPIEYEMAWGFHMNNRAAVKKNGKWVYRRKRRLRY